MPTNKKPLLFFIILIIGLSFSLISNANSNRINQLVMEGVKYHEQGEYHLAIQKYDAALKLDAFYPPALYERAYSHFALKEYNACVTYSKKGLRSFSEYNLAANMKADLYTVAASCMDAMGNVKDALLVFKQGLSEFPDYFRLNYNMAITLVGQNQHIRAIPYLEKAIVSKPNYVSSYFALGEVYRQKGSRIQSLFYHMRYLMLDPNSGRAKYAARTVIELLKSGIDLQDSRNTKIVVANSELDNETLRSMEMAALMAMASTYVIGHDKKVKKIIDLNDADLITKAMSSFIQICMESTQNDKIFQKTFIWKTAVQPIVNLHQKAQFNTFAYLISSNAGIKSAGTWLRKHRAEVEKLASMLQNNS